MLTCLPRGRISRLIELFLVAVYVSWVVAPVLARVQGGLRAVAAMALSSRSETATNLDSILMICPLSLDTALILTGYPSLRSLTGLQEETGNLPPKSIGCSLVSWSMPASLQEHS